MIPLRFTAGQGWRTLGLSGEETFEFAGLRAGVLAGAPIGVVATAVDGRRIAFTVSADVQTAFERRLLVAGGMLPSVLDHLTGAAADGTEVPTQAATEVAAEAANVTAISTTR